jgi:hypothetical protein
MPKAAPAAPAQINTASAMGVALTPSSSTLDAAQKLIEGGLFDAATPTANPAAPLEPAAPAAASTTTETQAASPAPATEPEAADEGAYASLEDYIGKQSLDRDSFYSLPVKAKVDGKELDVPLADLVKSYQLDQHLSAKSNAFAEERRAFETQRTQAQEQIRQQLQAAQTLGQLAQQELLREYQGVTPDDPARYLAAQQRIGAIQQYLAQNLQAQQQVSAAQLQAEQARLLDAVPEWREPAKFKEAQERTAAYVQSRGFTEAQLSLLTNAVNGDHQFALMLRDAVRAKDLQAEVDTLKAQLAGKTAAKLRIVRAAPQMASPGARVTQNPIRTRIADSIDAMRADRRHSMDSTLRAAQALVDAGIGA